MLILDDERLGVAIGSKFSLKMMGIKRIFLTKMCLAFMHMRVLPIDQRVSKFISLSSSRLFSFNHMEMVSDRKFHTTDNNLSNIYHKVTFQLVKMNATIHIIIPIYISTKVPN